MTIQSLQIWRRGTFCPIFAPLVSALFRAVLLFGGCVRIVLEHTLSTERGTHARFCKSPLYGRRKPLFLWHATILHAQAGRGCAVLEHKMSVCMGHLRRQCLYVSEHTLCMVGGMDAGFYNSLLSCRMKALCLWHATPFPNARQRIQALFCMWHATLVRMQKGGTEWLNSIAPHGMNVLERLAMRSLFCVFAFFIHGIVWAQPITDLGEISHQSSVQRLKLFVESPDSKAQAQAEKVFRLHGGIVLVKPNEAAFALRFIPKGDRSVELIIESGNPPKVLFKQLVMGSTPTQALLKACDLAVEKTLGIPGFFAGKLAFVGERAGSQEIYTGDLLFSDLHKVTDDKSHSISPHWSPDGAYLTYTGYYLSEFPDLFLVDLGTGKRKPIATYKGTNTGGVFSPSGEQLAMILSSSGNAEVYIADNRGRRPKRITRNKSLEASPTWSPDGQNLIFTSDQLGGPQLFKVDLRTKEQTRVPTNISRYCDEAVWNQRHPHLVAFTAAVNRSFQVALYNFKTRKATFLTNESVDCVEPCWASDGRHLFFTRRTGRDKQLHVLDTETGKVTALHSKDFGSASQASFIYPKSMF